jgi:hypothetical protein
MTSELDMSDVRARDWTLATGTRVGDRDFDLNSSQAWRRSTPGTWP